MTQLKILVKRHENARDTTVLALVTFGTVTNIEMMQFILCPARHSIKHSTLL
jgi:hypothetical protein